MNRVDDRIRMRASALGLVMLALISILASRLWFLQVLAGEEYAQAATANRVRLVTVSAPRGKILDRNGAVLVGTRTSLTVGIRRTDLRDERTVLPRLASLLGIRVEDIRKRLADKRVSPYKPVTIAEDVDSADWLMLRERSEEFPGVETSFEPVRLYPSGGIAAHVIGYTDEIGQGELAKLRDRGYRLGDDIGRSGVERTYEEALRGKPGLEKLEVDKTGTVLRTIGSEQPLSGKDVQLTLDIDVQRVAEDALAQGIARAHGQVFRETKERFRAPAGGVVVIDARNGEVVAMASYPTFDLARFAGGIDRDYWKQLNDPENDFPLLNRTTQAAYPPGSTFKPFVATAALQTGLSTTNSYFPCTSEFEFGERTFRNWRQRDATISLAQSLVESCDTVYYQMSRDWWLAEDRREEANKPVYEAMGDWARKFGFGRATRIDLAAEAKGRIPGREYKRNLWKRNRDRWCDRYRKTREEGWRDLCVAGYVWRGGDAVNMSIGQGDVALTPLQLALGYATLANGGSVVQPHLGMRVIDPETRETLREIAPKPVSNAGVDPRYRDYVVRALTGVPERGTATFPFRGWPFDRVKVAAKTGSAEIGGKQPFSWFAAFAPANAPRYVVVSVVEEAGFGSQVSGPIVRQIMDKLFGLPLTPIVYSTQRSD
ncbi:MAG: penicillin-binding protein 2 [Actinomycetota bacterium]